MRIIYFDIDTLRPDHLGCYGYYRNTSPNIDRMAAQGVRFENYYCSDAPCLPSRTALMSGQFGIHTGVVNHGGLAADIRPEGADRFFTGRLSYESLPGMLRTMGLKTASISPFADRHGAFHFYAGFNEIYDTGKKGMESGEEITPVAQEWIQKNGSSDNWFLHVNYWDPHTPYRAPEDFGEPFKESPLETWINKDILENHRAMAGPHKPRELSMYDNSVNPAYPRQPGEIKNLKDLKTVIDGYDTGIQYADFQIGKVLKTLEEQGVLDDTIIIISSDHGENYGELGIYAEHATADHSTCRIPLIIRWPGKTHGTVDKGLHYNIDLLPTLAELAGFKSYSMIGVGEQYPRWDGKSFSPAITDGEECGRDSLIISQCAHVCQRSVRFGDWLYMRTYHDGYHSFDKEMLFNLKDDPYEQLNLADKNPDMVKEGVYRLSKWHDEMMESMDSEVDPMDTVLKEGGPLHARGRLKNYCEYLKQTERKDAAKQLEERYPQEFYVKVFQGDDTQD